VTTKNSTRTLLKHNPDWKPITEATTIPVWEHTADDTIPKKKRQTIQESDSVWRIPLGDTLRDGRGTLRTPFTNVWYEVDRKVHPENWQYLSALYSTAGKYNKETGVMEPKLDVPLPTLIANPSINIPAVFSDAQQVLYKYDNVYSLPECTENLLGGNYIYDRATVDPYKVNMVNAGCRISGDAAIESGVITNDSMPHGTFSGLPLTSYNSDSKLFIKGKTVIRNSTIYYGCALTGNTLIEDSLLERVHVTSDDIDLHLNDVKILGANIESDGNINISGAKIKRIYTRRDANLSMSGSLNLKDVWFEGGNAHIEGNIGIMFSTFGGSFKLRATAPKGSSDSDYLFDRVNGYYILPLMLSQRDFESCVHWDDGWTSPETAFSINARGTLNLSAQLLRKPHNIEQFCCLPDTHLSDQCRCALYYPLFLLCHPMTVTYFIKMGGLDNSIPVQYQSLSIAQLESSMNNLIVEVGENLDMRQHVIHFIRLMNGHVPDIGSVQEMKDTIRKIYGVDMADIVRDNCDYRLPLGRNTRFSQG
jgi:hypothetical protein